MRPIVIQALLTLLLVPLSVTAQWTDRDGKQLAPTESMKSDGNFGVQIVLTADDDGFRKSWHSPAAPPTLRTTNTVARGASISAMVIFHGCTAGLGGKCDAAVTFTLLSPDGKSTHAGAGPLWGQAPVQGKLLLAPASVSIAFDKTDAPGRYKILATATDKVTGKKVQLSAPFTLQ
ncbi:MAG: hypothetical protein H0W47_18435 [Polaromonas sp.]|uniref:hypothetical protein n=1 Tax=Polaromonas sp. TaxID=1869339 RepID=UPI001841B7BB|nr:hypothetical protein [Polaromonas sp.]MBA3595739.1 hypothetical protein [Polaromonas sp.]